MQPAAALGEGSFDSRPKGSATSVLDPGQELWFGCRDMRSVFGAGVLRISALSRKRRNRGNPWFKRGTSSKTLQM
jgi:hypothetical protein